MAVTARQHDEDVTRRASCQREFTPNPVVDLAEKLAASSDHWSPKVVARMDDDEIKLVKVQGEFTWHSHTDTPKGRCTPC